MLQSALLFIFFAGAQNYESIKNAAILQQYKKAKEDFEKASAKSGFLAKPEAYMLKAAVWSGLANEKDVKGTDAEYPLIMEADAAFVKYREMDPALALISDPFYQNAPISIYSALFSSGYKDYESKNWQPGFQKFKKVVEYGDLMISKKIINITADTNSLLLAGITAENAGLKDDAAIYYSRLANLKIGGSGYESIYRFLVNYNFTKKDMAGFEKYKALGLQLYPSSDFFTYDKVDFAVGLEDNFDKKLAMLDDVIAADPGNYKAERSLGEIIYDTLNSRKPNAVLPANADALETKMIAAFNKAAGLKANDEVPFIYIGDHYMNKSLKIDDERTALKAAIKARTKPGTPISKDDAAKRDALDATYRTALDAAREPYEKAAQIFSKKPTITQQDKPQYQKVSGYLADIYADKSTRPGTSPADKEKFNAESKKWNALYDSIK